MHIQNCISRFAAIYITDIIKQTALFMIAQQEDRFNFLGRVLFMVLFLLVICVHFDRVKKTTYFSTQYELISEFHSISNHAVCVSSVQTPSLQKNQVTLDDKSGLYLLNKNYKLSYDNNLMSNKIILLQKSFLSMKPFIISRFQYHLFALDAGEPPLLS